MIRVLLIALILTIVLAPGRLHAADVIMQDIAVRLDPDENRLHAKLSMTLADPEMQWPRIFRLAGNASILRVSAGGETVPYDFSHGRLQISAVDAKSDLSLVYTIRFNDPVPEDIVGIEDPSYGVAATVMRQGVYLSEASAWHPVAAGMQNLFTVAVSGPGKMTGVTAGRMKDYFQSDAETRVVWETMFPMSALALAAGHFNLSREALGEIQLLTFFTDENAALAAGYLESMSEYLGLYQELFGPYPYEKFAVVENFYPTGYGMPGWTLLGSRVIRLPFIRTTSLPHEIAHAWWGNAVEIDSASGNWGEGLATYVADYYLKELNAPQEALEYRRKLLRDYAALVTVDDDLPLTSFRSRMSKRDQAVGYGKAAMVFHMLRELIGDDHFWKGLQGVASEGRGQRYAWGDLRRHFEAVADMDLEAFFRQWLTRTGAPELALSAVDVIKVDSGWQVSGNILQGQPGYDLAVPLRLVTEKRSYEQVVGFRDRQDCFVFTVADPPVSLVVDPDNHLFRKLDQSEIPATVNDLRASRAPLVVVASGAEALQEASRDLLRGLQWHQADVVSEKVYLAAPPAGRDLLFLGRPMSPALQPELPQEAGTSQGSLPIPAKLETDNSDVLFMVQQKEEGDHVIAYFLPGSVAAAKDTARRIPHYGRYSYLTFRDGRNLLKMTWEPVNSPLQVLFEKDDAQ